jgi:hypothetical protein
VSRIASGKARLRVLALSPIERLLTFAEQTPKCPSDYAGERRIMAGQRPTAVRQVYSSGLSLFGTTLVTQECRVLPLFALLLRFCLAFVSRSILGKSIQFVQLHRY